MKTKLPTTIEKCLHFALLPVLALGFQICGLAQSNLVNLSDWTVSVSGETDIGSFMLPSVSSNSALFPSQSQTGHAILTGILDTTPGTAYEISYAVVYDGYTEAGAELTFGSFGVPTDFPAQNEPTYVQIDYDFTVVATDQITTMTIGGYPDIGAAAGVLFSNVSVIAVPEPSSWLLMIAGASALVLAQRRSRSNP